MSPAVSLVVSFLFPQLLGCPSPFARGVTPPLFFSRLQIRWATLLREDGDGKTFLCCWHGLFHPGGSFSLCFPTFSHPVSAPRSSCLWATRFSPQNQFLSPSIKPSNNLHPPSFFPPPCGKHRFNGIDVLCNVGFSPSHADPVVLPLVRPPTAFPGRHWEDRPVSLWGRFSAALDDSAPQPPCSCR